MLHNLKTTIGREKRLIKASYRRGGTAKGLLWFAGIIVGMILMLWIFGGDDNVTIGTLHPTVKGTHDLESFVMANCDEETQQIWEQVAWYAEYQGIDPALPFAIAWSDSGCGTNMTTANNPGNVGNDDSGNRRGFANMFTGWKAIVDTLNNSQMGGLELVGHLSQGGRNRMVVNYSCRGASAPYKCYASSETNHINNTLNALRAIYPDREIDEYWNYRLTK